MNKPGYYLYILPYIENSLNTDYSVYFNGTHVENENYDFIASYQEARDLVTKIQNKDEDTLKNLQSLLEEIVGTHIKHMLISIYLMTWDDEKAEYRVLMTSIETFNIKL